MHTPDFIQALSSRLAADLPGWDAQRLMIPEGREILSDLDDLHPAAVLIALYEQEGQWVFPLIQRSIDGFAHSGQIALPGGRQDGEETSLETALREAWEEVHIDPGKVHILDKLTALPIPVSKHMVQPVIGWLEEVPDLIPDPREVEQILVVAVNELMDQHVEFEGRTFKGQNWEIPFLRISGKKVWGATAMILSEFRGILAGIHAPRK